MFCGLDIMKTSLVFASVLVVASIVLQVSATDELWRTPKVKTLDAVFLSILPKLLLQRPPNENGTFAKYAKFAYRDFSNEDASTHSLQELIIRSGYKYENHYVLADDGYITQLTRLINPLADPRELKQPPVVIFHGGIINPTAYVVASSIQHHPEAYPRPEGDMHTSSNRSLGFMLANNGYDVWLVGTRGASRENQGHLKYKVFQPSGFLFKDEWVDKDTSKIETAQEIADSFKYWDFSMDDIIQYEIKNQINKVLEVTGAKKVSLFLFSLSSLYVPSALQLDKELSKKIHNYINMAPIINAKGVNLFMGAVFKTFARFEYKLGTIIWSGLILSQIFRDIILSVSLSRDLRYTLVKGVTNYIAGSNPKYYTNLEGPVDGHIFEPAGFKLMQHYFQQVLAGRHQKYDYGLVKNELVYGSAKPPEYHLSKLWIHPWMLVSAENDNLATQGSVRAYLSQVPVAPEVHAFYPKANHLDLFAGFENAFYVNLPVLRFLDKHSLPPLKEPRTHLSPNETLFQKELIAFVPARTDLIRSTT